MSKHFFEYLLRNFFMIILFNAIGGFYELYNEYNHIKSTFIRTLRIGELGMLQRLSILKKRCKIIYPYSVKQLYELLFLYLKCLIIPNVWACKLK